MNTKALKCYAYAYIIYCFKLLKSLSLKQLNKNQNITQIGDLKIFITIKQLFKRPSEWRP